MSTKKTEVPSPVAEQVQEAITEITEKPYDIWEDYVEMVVPRAHRGEAQSIFVEINGRSAQIPLDGKKQKIRRPWAEALQDYFKAETAAEDFAESIPNDQPLEGSARV